MSNRKSGLVALAAVWLVATGCDDDALSPLQVAGATATAILPMGLALDPAFGTNGEVALSYVALGASGEPLQARALPVTAAIETPGSCYTVSILRSGRRAPAGSQLDAALILDASGSMASNDPNWLRVPAAEGFATTFLSANSANRVAVFDFGAGATSGFQWSRMLTGLTSDLGTIRQALGLVAASGNTPMYASVHEVMSYLQGASSAASARVAVVLGDGLPNAGNITLPQVIQHSNQLAIPIYTVGLGPAAADAPGNSPAAVGVMQQMALATGGAYASLSGAGALAQTFGALATGLALGHYVTTLRVAPVPRAGERIQIVVRSAGSGGAQATWTLQVPNVQGLAGPGC
jgi:Mg-chelatase subunit ChlD